MNFESDTRHGDVPSARVQLDHFLGAFFSDPSAIRPFIPAELPEDVDLRMIAETILFDVISDSNNLSSCLPLKEQYVPWLTMFDVGDVIHLMTYTYFSDSKINQVRRWFLIDGSSSDVGSLKTAEIHVSWSSNCIRMRVHLNHEMNSYPISDEEFKYFFHGTDWAGAHYFRTKGPHGKTSNTDFGLQPKFYCFTRWDHAYSWAKSRYAKRNMAVIIIRIRTVDWENVQSDQEIYTKIGDPCMWKDFVRHCRRGSDHDPFLRMEDTPIIEGDMCVNPQQLRYNAMPIPHSPPKSQIAFYGKPSIFWDKAEFEMFLFGAETE